MSISDILHHKGNQVVKVAPTDTVLTAVTKLAERRIGAVIVEDDWMRLVGIFSERDYARKGILGGHTSRETKVSQLMTSPVISVSPKHTVDECMSLMTDRDFRHLPVVQNDTVVGVVSIGDLVKWVISGQQQTIQALEGYIAGAYPS